MVQKKMKKKLHPKETIAEGVKLRRQKSDIPPLEGD